MPSQQVDQALFDVGLEFGQNCPATIDGSARKAVAEFFDKNFKCLLEEDLMDWDNEKDRGFALYCAADLGRTARTEALEHGGVVTRATVYTAAGKRISAWEKRCHLPPTSECGIGGLGEDERCLRMRAMLDQNRS